MKSQPASVKWLFGQTAIFAFAVMCHEEVYASTLQLGPLSLPSFNLADVMQQGFMSMVSSLGLAPKQSTSKPDGQPTSVYIPPTAATVNKPDSWGQHRNRDRGQRPDVNNKTNGHMNTATNSNGRIEKMGFEGINSARPTGMETNVDEESDSGGILPPVNLNLIVPAITSISPFGSKRCLVASCCSVSHICAFFFCCDPMSQAP